MKLTKKLLFGCVAMSAMTLASCSSEELAPASQVGEDVYGEGAGLVTLTINSEAYTAGTRAGADKGLGHISDGAKVDALIFAVYEIGDNDEQTLAKEFAKSTTSSVTGITLGEGQNVIAVTPESWPVTIKLATDPNKTYKMAFWAQSSKATCFTTTDLTNVQVSYANAKNNDELRDAFCVTTRNFSGSEQNLGTVVLRRPFAQINVGTTGADYAQLLQGEAVYPNKTFRYSKIYVNGVSNTMDVLNDEIKKGANQIQDVTFDWSPIPAWFNFTTLPTSLADILQVTDEEYLKVELNGDTTFEGYLTAYPTVEKDEQGAITKYLSETFKYMSMCYVLVPADRLPDGFATDPNNPTGQGDPFASTMLDDVKVSFAENPDGTDNVGTDATAAKPAGATYIALKNVPVHRNWRTNILGGLNTTNDDETTIFGMTKILVDLNPLYDGEYNTIHGTQQWLENDYSKTAPAN